MSSTPPKFVDITVPQALALRLPAPTPISIGSLRAGQKIQAPMTKAPTAMIQSRASILRMKSMSASLASVLVI